MSTSGLTVPRIPPPKYILNIMYCKKPLRKFKNSVKPRNMLDESKLVMGGWGDLQGVRYIQCALVHWYTYIYTEHCTGFFVLYNKMLHVSTSEVKRGECSLVQRTNRQKPHWNLRAEGVEAFSIHPPIEVWQPVNSAAHTVEMEAWSRKLWAWGCGWRTVAGCCWRGRWKCWGRGCSRRG